MSHKATAYIAKHKTSCSSHDSYRESTSQVSDRDANQRRVDTDHTSSETQHVGQTQFTHRNKSHILLMYSHPRDLRQAWFQTAHTLHRDRDTLITHHSVTSHIASPLAHTHPVPLDLSRRRVTASARLESRAAHSAQARMPLVSLLSSLRPSQLSHTKRARLPCSRACLSHERTRAPCPRTRAP